MLTRSHGLPSPAPGFAQDWANHKYVVHLDGLACSSKLEQTLTLGCAPGLTSTPAHTHLFFLIRPA